MKGMKFKPVAKPMDPDVKPGKGKLPPALAEKFAKFTKTAKKKKK